MEIHIRDMQNDMIKPFQNGVLLSVVHSVTHKVLINDITLRLFIPPQVRKMTHKLRHICRCELCIIPKGMQIDLNRFITRLVTDLQQKSAVRHTRTSFFCTTSASHYKDIVFPDDECLHATIKDAAQCITCLSIKPNNMIHIKFDLVFF